jgi:hypothetical protein
MRPTPVGDIIITVREVCDVVPAALHVSGKAEHGSQTDSKFGGQIDGGLSDHEIRFSDAVLQGSGIHIEINNDLPAFFIPQEEIEILRGQGAKAVDEDNFKPAMVEDDPPSRRCRGVKQWSSAPGRG